MTTTCPQCKRPASGGPLCMHCGAFLQPPVSCPGCKRVVAAGVAKCQICGAAITPVKPPDLISCPKCGKKMGAHLSRCVMCGASLGRPDAAPAAAVDTNQVMAAASAHLQAGRNAEALALLELTLLSAKGACLHNAGKWDEALVCYNESIRVKPNDPHTLYCCGNTLRFLGRMPEAVERYLQAVRLDPGKAEAIGNLALSLRDIGRYAESIPHASRIVLANPRALPFANCLGFCLMKTGNPADALPNVKLAATAEPGNPNYQIDLGLCLEALKRQAEADACFESAAKRDAMSPRPNFHIARLRERQNQLPDAAEFYYRSAVGFINAQRNHVLSAHDQADCETALKSIRRLRAHFERASEGTEHLAAAQKAEAAGNISEALANYEEAYVLDSDVKAAYDGMVRMRAARRAERAAKAR